MATEGLCVKLGALSRSEVLRTCRTVVSVTQFIPTRHTLTHTTSYTPGDRESEKERESGVMFECAHLIMYVCVCVCQHTLVVVALSLPVHDAALTRPGAARPIRPLGPVTKTRTRAFVAPLYTLTTTTPLDTRIHTLCLQGHEHEQS